jgi:hypothetical protein
LRMISRACSRRRCVKRRSVALRTWAFADIRRVLDVGGRIVVGELHDDPHRLGPATLRTLAARCGVRVVGRTTVDSGELSEVAAGERSERPR